MWIKIEKIIILKNHNGTKVTRVNDAAHEPLVYLPFRNILDSTAGQVSAENVAEDEFISLQRHACYIGLCSLWQISQQREII